jgi:hypothetical protein
LPSLLHNAAPPALTTNKHLSKLRRTTW